MRSLNRVWSKVEQDQLVSGLGDSGHERSGCKASEMTPDVPGGIRVDLSETDKDCLDTVDDAIRGALVEPGMRRVPCDFKLV